MSEPTGDKWRQTACILCYVNCGVELGVEGRRIVRVRGDKAHPRSRGYLCQKAQRLHFYGEHADRLQTPLRRTAVGGFEAVSWETALTDIAGRLRELRAAHGGDGFGFYGGGGQGNHLGGAYGVSLMRAMGSSNYYSALSQEKTGDFWVNGHLFGGQSCHTAEDVENTDLLVVVGCNPWLAHGFPNARLALKEIRNDPGRRMLVIDPRRTEAAEMADLHLQVRPGTDAFLLGAILALILRRGGEDRAFLESRTTGFEEVAAVLSQVPVEAWVAHAGVPLADVERAVDMMLAAASMCVRVELGLQQSRHSTLNSYLEKLLFLITGNFARRGGNNLHSWLQPLWGNSRGEHSAVSGQEQIAGLYPPNRLTEEILTDHPRRMRALWVDSSNPANTAADTTRVEQALRELELLVVVDVAMTETAALADYVLPASSQYEKWEYTLFTLEFPSNMIHVRRPVFEPLPGTLPEPEIYTRLLRAMDALPPEDELAALRDLAATDRIAFSDRLRTLLGSQPAYAAVAPVVLYETLGRTLPDGVGAAVPLWPACHSFAQRDPAAVRAAGIVGEGAQLGEALFARVISSESGAVFSVHDYEDVWSMLRHRDRRVHLAVTPMLDWIARLDPAQDGVDPAYPFTLVNGQRRMHNANQIFRTPAWRKSDPDGALRIHPDDLAGLGGTDGGWMEVATESGRLVARVEVDDSLRPGVVSLPHGYGQGYPDGRGGRLVDGPRINLLTAGDDSDPIAATPHHKNVRVRLRPAGSADAAAAEERSERVRELAAAERG
jgi:anaerobic selenocysteine-containing dehydrogenase